VPPPLIFFNAYPNNPVADASLCVGGWHGDAALRLFG